MSRKKHHSVVDFLSERETSTSDALLLRRRFASDRLAHSSTLYKKNLVGHFGCVNAIEFSNNGGDYLASGMWYTLLYAQGEKVRNLGSSFQGNLKSRRREILTIYLDK